MDRDKELRRLEALIIKMRGRIIEIHNYNRIMKLLNSISDLKFFNGILKILCEGFKIDGSSLLVLKSNRLETSNSLETIAFYGAHSTMHYIAGKGALFFASTTLIAGKAQSMSTETGVLLSLPIIKEVGSPLGVLNLYRSKLLTHKSPGTNHTVHTPSSLPDRIGGRAEPLTFLEASFSEIDQRLFIDIASQIGVTLERILFSKIKI